MKPHWRKIGPGWWNASGLGTVSRSGRKWYGHAGAYKNIGVEPIVGPFTTAAQAKAELEKAVEKHRTERQ